MVASGTQAELYTAHAGEPQLSVEFLTAPKPLPCTACLAMLRHTLDAQRRVHLHHLDASAACWRPWLSVACRCAAWRPASLRSKTSSWPDRCCATDPGPP